jgi:hypothetical protein
MRIEGEGVYDSNVTAILAVDMTDSLIWCCYSDYPFCYTSMNFPDRSVSLLGITFTYPAMCTTDVIIGLIIVSCAVYASYAQNAR